MKTELTTVERINNEINLEFNEKTRGALMATTFKGLNEQVAKQAIMEALLRGFEFKDFLQKDVYALAFFNKKRGVQEYSLITSIDHARKRAQKNGLFGKTKPIFIFKEDGKTVESCEITVTKQVGDHFGDFTALVYFDEYNTGKNQWAKRPKTMIAKVAEMHALRMGFPEDLSQIYTAEEFDKEAIEVVDENQQGLETHQIAINEITTLKGLKEYYKEHEGEGKDFAKMVTDRKAGIRLVLDAKKKK